MCVCVFVVGRKEQSAGAVGADVQQHRQRSNTSARQFHTQADFERQGLVVCQQSSPSSSQQGRESATEVRVAAVARRRPSPVDGQVPGRPRPAQGDGAARRIDAREGAVTTESRESEGFVRPAVTSGRHRAAVAECNA